MPSYFFPGECCWCLSPDVVAFGKAVDWSWRNLMLYPCTTQNFSASTDWSASSFHGSVRGKAHRTIPGASSVSCVWVSVGFSLGCLSYNFLCIWNLSLALLRGTLLTSVSLPSLNFTMSMLCCWDPWIHFNDISAIFSGLLAPVADWFSSVDIHQIKFLNNFTG